LPIFDETRSVVFRNTNDLTKKQELFSQAVITGDNVTGNEKYAICCLKSQSAFDSN